MLDAQRLQVLAEVARAGSIASAARRLAFTPSAVSQQIGKLERDLGCEVLHRHPRGVTLTPVGQALVSHAEAVTGELRAAEQTVRAMLGTQPRRLAVGTFASAGQSLVPGALARFRRHHPDVALSLRTSNHRRLRAGHLRRPRPADHPPLPRDAAARSPRAAPAVAVARPAPDRSARGPPEGPHARLSVTDLADEEWISGGVGEPNRVSLELAARSAGSRPHIAYETRDYQVTLALIEAGLGIALVPASVLGHTGRPGIAFRPIEGSPWPARSTWCTASGQRG